MAKVRVNFKDFVEMLDDCGHGHHFESTTGDGELLLILFIDGNPSSWEMSVRSGLMQVATEVEL